ncbi:MAG TPA: serine hydrolase [Ignavibacteriales bacterium]|nr:serine hydrolase [Ignavibacteriales bacterium]
MKGNRFVYSSLLGLAALAFLATEGKAAAFNSNYEGILSSGKMHYIVEDSASYNFSQVDSLIIKAEQDSAFPGAVLLVGYNDKVVYHKAYGRYTYDKNSPVMTKEAMFDLASVSIVIGTTTAAMMLYDEGKLNLDEYVKFYLPEFGNNGKENIKVRNLLLHNAGFTAWKPFYKKLKLKEEVIDSIMRDTLEYSIGEKYIYSDLGMITLQQIIERISGKPLNEFLNERVFAPLKMAHTMYAPPKELWKNCAPTEIDNYWRNKTMQGEVHDEAAYLLNGVAGHAGLFSTAADLSIFISMLRNGGVYENKPYIKRETIDNWTTVQNAEQSTRGLGWDTKSAEKSSAGHYFSMNSFGHTGFTGTSVWVDKDNGLFVILLTNRVYPTRNNSKLNSIRPKIHDAVFKAVIK